MIITCMLHHLVGEFYRHLIMSLKSLQKSAIHQYVHHRYNLQKEHQSTKNYTMNLYLWQKKISKKLSKITFQIESLQEQNEEIKTMLENFMKKPTNSNNNAFSDDELNELNIRLPLSDKIHFLEVESMMLSDQEFYSKMIITLKALGGADLTAIVNTVLAKCMTNCLAIQYSFAGKQKKVSFKETFPTVLKAIINVVRFHRHLHTKKFMIKLVGGWCKRN